MNIYFDLLHPAHLHLFRNAMPALRNRGHHTFVGLRRKDVLCELATNLQIEHQVFSGQASGFLGRALELVRRNIAVARHVLQNHIDLLVGTSPTAAQVARLTGRRSVIFEEDDLATIRSFALAMYPFATWICTPDSIPDNLGRKHVKYPGYHELAYLHPDNFTPDPTVPASIGVQPGQPYFILRFVSLRACHDSGHLGINEQTRAELVRILSGRGRVFVTSETTLPPQYASLANRIPVHKMHDAMAHATLLISDSQTMTVEAAVLGVPALRCNTFVGQCSIIEELENRYQLTRGFLPRDSQNLLQTVQAWLDDPTLAQRWQTRRARMLADKIDVARWITDFLDSRPLAHSHKHRTEPGP